MTTPAPCQQGAPTEGHDMTTIQQYRDALESPEYKAFEERMLAVEEGRAVDLTNCYICDPEAPACSAIDFRFSLRGIISRRTPRKRHPEADVHEVLTLSCGHEVI